MVTVMLRQMVKMRMPLLNGCTNAILSYRTHFISITNASALLNFELVGSDAKIVYIAFEVIVITENNPDLEWASIELSNQSFSAS